MAQKRRGNGPRSSRRLFGRGDRREMQRVAALLRQETVGGAVLLAAALVALVWANSPWRDGYLDLAQAHVGVERFGLRLTVAEWAADGLLTLFFLVVGLELKHEFRHGDLRDPARAVVPVVAAACGVAVPALVYVVVESTLGGPLHGWAIPTATDIAFALAVLAVLGAHLPSALRSFLLTLAVVDDLIAILIIAFFYADHIRFMPLLIGLAGVAGFAAATRISWFPAWLLVAPGLVAWVGVLNSGVHATIAGVLLGLSVPVTPARGPSTTVAQRLERWLRPIVAGVCVPLFAFFAAGVTVVGDAFGAALRSPITLGVVLGLLVGKPIGVFAGTWVMARFTRAQLDDGLAWPDVFGLSLLAGIGFTVSLLIGHLAFDDVGAQDHAKVGVLAGSVLAALGAAVVLRRRNRVHGALASGSE